MTSQGSLASGITADDLAKVSRTVFSGHPPVGTNVLQAYAVESGHLSGKGARIAATAWLQAIAPASPR